jgi:hypothetical protein
MQFSSKIQRHGILYFDQWKGEVKNEDMFFGASVSFILSQDNAPITKRLIEPALGILDAASDPEHVIIDTRVHMLMPGWYPCIPGWHHDDVARTRSDGQPNYAEQPYLPRHVLFVLNADVAPTEFAIGEHELPDVPLGQKVYQTWHPIVEQQIQDGKLERVAVRDSEMVSFDWQTMHRGTAAVSSGWRYFFRASIRSPRHRNEIRRQVQIYVPGDVNKGW